MQDEIKTILAELGEKPEREGLLKTPERVEEVLKFLTSGYTVDPKSIFDDHHLIIIDGK